jgi:hypothetical protein
MVSRPPKRAILPPPCRIGPDSAKAEMVAFPKKLVSLVSSRGSHAIGGKTLLLLTKRGPVAVPLSEFDIAATQAANEQRGIQFRLPEARLASRSPCLLQRPPQRMHLLEELAELAIVIDLAVVYYPDDTVFIWVGIDL